MVELSRVGMGTRGHHHTSLSSHPVCLVACRMHETAFWGFLVHFLMVSVFQEPREVWAACVLPGSG